MKLERPRPAVLRVTLSAHEMAALIAAARWAVEGGGGDLPSEAQDRLRQVVASYAAAVARLADG